MIRSHTTEGLEWINIENPGKHDAVMLVDTHGISPYIAESLLTKIPYSSMEQFGPHLFITLHFPIKSDVSSSSELEVDFIIGHNLLVTSYFGNSELILEIEELFDTLSFMHSKSPTNKAGFLFSYILKTIYHAIASELDRIAHSLYKLEEDIFEGSNEEINLKKLSSDNRKIIDFKRALKFHDTILKRIEDQSALNHYFQITDARLLREEYEVVIRTIDTQKNILDDLRETANILLNTRNNKVMKIISVVIFTTVPINIVLNAMSATAPLPFLQTPTQELLILAISILIGIVLYTSIRYDKWL